MSEMVERVGAALRKECEAVFGASWSNDKAWRFARAAIAALREPPDEIAEVMNAQAANGMVDWRDIINAYVDAALGHARRAEAAE